MTPPLHAFVFLSFLLWQPPSADQIMARVEQAGESRRQAAAPYSSVRDYTVENSRFHVRATMQVEVSVEASGRKSFRILTTSGSSTVRRLVFQRMLDTETRASAPETQAATRISRANYSFHFTGTAGLGGRTHYTLEAAPKAKNPLLFRGRVWIDAEHFAVARIEGEPAQRPSFWVKRTRFVHDYVEAGGQWLPRQNRSESDIRLFGRSTTTILYGSYQSRTD